MTVQYREVLGGETRAIGDESAREIEAKVCSYGVGPDTYSTTWHRGTFAEGLRESLPAVCWSHQSDNVIGSVTGYRDESDGLYVQMRLADFDAVPEARKAYSLIKDGHIRGWSFGFADGEIEPDRDHKGAMAFRKATMYEVSPVLRASVPLTRTVSVRSADGAVEAHDENELAAALTVGIRAAMDAGAGATITIGSDGVVDIGGRTEEQQQGDAGDVAGERITLVANVLGTGNTSSVTVPAGARSVTLTINDDGTVSAGGYANGGGDTSDAGDTSDQADPDEDAGQLASAVDAALDAYAGLMDGVDVTELPAVVQQALALVDAAGVAVDELLDAMGLPDPDEDGDRSVKGDEVTVGKRKGTVDKVMPNGALLVDWGDGKKSLVSAADASEADGGDSRAADEPDPADAADGDSCERAPGDKNAANTAASNGEYADPGYQADKKKRYPLSDAAQAKAAWSYINQKDNAALYSADNLAKVKAKIVAACKKFGVEISDDGSRSDEPDIEATRAALDLLAVR